MSDSRDAPLERPSDPMENWLMKPALEWLEQAEHGENKSRCRGIAALLRDLWRQSLPLETGAQSDCCGGKCLMRCPPASPAATPTPRTDEACKENGCPTSLVTADFARTLERECADLRGKLANEVNIAAGWKATAEVAEAKLATARADERERCAKVLEARAESVEGPTNAYAVGELYEAALAIRALKEASNG